MCPCLRASFPVRGTLRVIEITKSPSCLVTRAALFPNCFVLSLFCLIVRPFLHPLHLHLSPFLHLVFTSSWITAPTASLRFKNRFIRFLIFNTVPRVERSHEKLGNNEASKHQQWGQTSNMWREGCSWKISAMICSHTCPFCSSLYCSPIVNPDSPSFQVSVTLLVSPCSLPHTSLARRTPTCHSTPTCLRWHPNRATLPHLLRQAQRDICRKPNSTVLHWDPRGPRKATQFRHRVQDDPCLIHLWDTSTQGTHFSCSPAQHMYLCILWHRWVRHAPIQHGTAAEWKQTAKQQYICYLQLSFICLHCISCTAHNLQYMSDLHMLIQGLLHQYYTKQGHTKAINLLLCCERTPNCDTKHPVFWCLSALCRLAAFSLGSALLAGWWRAPSDPTKPDSSHANTAKHHPDGSSTSARLPAHRRVDHRLLLLANRHHCDHQSRAGQQLLPFQSYYYGPWTRL